MKAVSDANINNLTIKVIKIKVKKRQFQDII